MLNFDYYAPTKVVFGKDAQMRCAGLVKECGGTRVFLLYGGGSAVKSGLIGTIEQNLRENGLVCETLRRGASQPISFIRSPCGRKSRRFRRGFYPGGRRRQRHRHRQGRRACAGQPGPSTLGFLDKGEKTAGCTPVGAVLTIPAAGSENEQFVRAYR